MPTITVQGEQLHYYVHRGAPESKRPPLVLVHGAGGSLMHWPGEIRRLREENVYALDLPGHGASGGQGRAEIAAYAEVVHDFGVALQLSSLVLVGHSMGGAIVLEYALRYAHALVGVVPVATGARLRVAPELLYGLRNDFDNTVHWLAVRSHADQASPDQMALYVKRMCRLPRAVIYDDFLACNSFDRMADLEHISLPTLVICGEADRMTPPKYSRTLAEQIPNAQLVLVAGAGHMVMLEPASTSVVVESIRRFLKTLEDPPV
jgi:pimeloyl-ACP methyl ester carboxylesterase